MTKRVVGWIGVVLGILGILLCVIVIVQAWWLNDVVTTQFLKLFPPVEAIFEFGDQAATQFDTLVENTQTQFNTVADAQPVATALREEIIRARILVNSATRLIESVDAILSQFARTERLTSALDDVVTTLNSTEILAQQIQDGRTDVIDSINTELDTLRERSSALEMAIDDANSDLAQIKSSVPYYVDLVSFAITILLLWFGFAQYNLLYNGWRWARQTQRPIDQVQLQKS